MKHPLPRSAFTLFTAGCLGCGLVALPAQQTLAKTIDYPDDGTTLQTDPVRRVPGSLFPGTADVPGLSGNSVTVNGDVPGIVFGGLTAGSDDVTNNRVTLESGTVSSDIYGGWSDSGNATNNTAAISGGKVSGDVWGGWSAGGSGSATGNSVTVSGAAIVGGSILGGETDSGSDSAAAIGNTVNIIMDIAGGHVDGYVYGGYAWVQSSSGEARATANEVKISGDADVLAVRSSVYGGCSLSDSSLAVATDNIVTISGGNKVGGEVTGGAAYSNSGSARATDNTVTITGDADVASSVTGGYAYINTGSATASDNHVIIGGDAHVGGDVFGGYVWSNSGNAVATANNNTVTISGRPVFADDAVLYGGFIDGAGAGDAFSGNTLNLRAAGLTVAGLYNFENINFYLPTTLAANGTMLNVSGEARLSENADGSGKQATVNVAIDGGNSPLRTGDKVILINANTLTGSPSQGEGIQGVTLEYTFDITTAGNQLVATVASVGADEESKSLSEGFVSGPALVNQTADFVADKGTAQAVEAAGGGKSGAGYNLGGFGAVTGGQSRYNTGSHTDVSSLSLMAGLARGNDLAPGRLTLGTFFEYGNGSYDAYNSFAGGPDVHGEGDMSHFGGGVLGRMDFTSAGPGMFYVEASARAGSVNNDYKNGNLAGQAVSYESDAAYYGIHAGLGYIWHLTAKTALDLYGKYFWTRQDGDAVRLSTGDQIRFDSVDSQRLRLGGRLVYAVNGFIAPYAGLAYEREFDGEARATAYGQTMQAPSLQGGTGIGELGLAFKATKSMPLSADLGIQGYVGVREGFTVSAQIRYDF